MSRAIVICSRSAAETASVAGALVPLIEPGDVILLDGDLGAGKTTFTQGLGRSAGVEGAITSPTFTLLRSYPTAIGPVLLHGDMYRLEVETEIAQLGLADLLDDDAFAVIEWGSRALGAIGPDHLDVSIVVEASSHGQLRRISMVTVGRRWAVRHEAIEAALQEKGLEVVGSGATMTTVETAADLSATGRSPRPGSQR